MAPFAVTLSMSVLRMTFHVCPNFLLLGLLAEVVMITVVVVPPPPRHVRLTTFCPDQRCVFIRGPRLPQRVQLCLGSAHVCVCGRVSRKADVAWRSLLSDPTSTPPL